MPGLHAFGPERRLLDKSAFDRVFAAPDFKFRRHPFMMLARRRPAGPSRLGMVVGKKHARRAVDRNLIRRLARDRFRLQSGEDGVDVILMARPGASACDRAELTEALRWLFERLVKEARGPAHAAVSPPAGAGTP